MSDLNVNMAPQKREDHQVELSGLEPLTSCMPVSLGMSVPGIPAGTGQGWCLAAAGDSLHA